jgi:two-component system NtrC family sensor kinase
MIVGIGAILLVVISAFAIIASVQQQEYQEHLARHEAELIAGVAERGLERAMERGETDVVQAILRRMGEHSVVTRIRIVGLQGTILRSNKAEEAGQLLALGGRPTERTTPEPFWDFRERTVSVFRPIVTGPMCLRCHSGAGPTLGLLNVVISFPTVESSVSQHWTFMILAAVLSLVVMGASIGVLFTFGMGRRIDLLSQTMRQVEAGDLTAHVEEEGPDELGRLAKSFNAMVARLADAHRQLEDRHLGAIRRAEHMASLGKMAAGIAHEINNPLAGMQNCVRSLLKGVKDDAQRREYLTMLREGLGRIGRTVGQLLNFAREAEPQLTRVDLPHLLRRSLALLEHDLAARRINFSVAAEHGIPVLLADGHQLEQVFMNILINAMDAMPAGGEILVSISPRQREMGLFVEVQITDTGVGIAPEHLPRIFDPFFTTKDVGKGTGLGLSVSYGIVRAHGGFVDVKSEVGRGSTFTVALPIKVEGESDAPSDPASGR